jgi:hypothetical protein
MNRSRSFLIAPVLLAAASCAQQVTAPRPTTAEPSPRIVAAICGGGPTRAVRVLRNASGAIGGYVAVPSIMDSPISYFDADGKPLTVFHIFDSDAAKTAASAIIARLSAAFPREEIVPCPPPRH